MQASSVSAVCLVKQLGVANAKTSNFHISGMPNAEASIYLLLNILLLLEGLLQLGLQVTDLSQVLRRLKPAHTEERSSVSEQIIRRCAAKILTSAQIENTEIISFQVSLMSNNKNLKRGSRKKL